MVRRLWWLMAGAVGAVLALFAAMPDRFRALGVNHLGPWFLDLYAILASNDALARGLDPYAHNPLDVFGRPHVYSHWWLSLGSVGLTRDDILWLGAALGTAFVGAALAWLRPRRLGEVVGALAVLLSPPVLLALDRANNDLVIFVLLAPVVPCLLAECAWVRLLAVPPIIVAVLLKVYPAVALLVLLGLRDPRELRRVVWVGALALAVVLPDVVRDLARYGRIVPEMEGLTTFGARHLIVGLELPSAWARPLGVVCGAGVWAAWWWRNPLAGWTPTDRRAWLAFILGASLLSGCFFAGGSFAYRWIFALWLVPLLGRLPRDEAAPRAVRRWAGMTAVLLLWALWADAAASSAISQLATGASPERVMQLADRFSYAEQPLLWAFFICLLAFLTHFARDAWRVWRTPAG